MPERDGWNYHERPEGGDARKFVTLEQDGMTWVGIRAYSATMGRWLNNNEPETATVVAWKDLDQPARGRWQRGLLVLPLSEIAPGFTLADCGCREDRCEGRTDGTCHNATNGELKP